MRITRDVVVRIAGLRDLLRVHDIRVLTQDDWSFDRFDDLENVLSFDMYMS
jgi:hypothetical protein